VSGTRGTRRPAPVRRARRAAAAGTSGAALVTGASGASDAPAGAARAFPPVARADARVLVLGSMPGRASLAASQYYAHPRNAFWPIIGELFGLRPLPGYAQRVAWLKAQGIALWDVVHACVRPGSLDADIDNASVVPNDFAGFFAAHPHLVRVLFNGATAEALFRRHVLAALGTPPRPQLRRMPSTSPANAAWSFERKLAAWRDGLAPALEAPPPRRAAR